MQMRHGSPLAKRIAIEPVIFRALKYKGALAVAIKQAPGIIKIMCSLC